LERWFAHPLRSVNFAQHQTPDVGDSTKLISVQINEESVMGGRRVDVVASLAQVALFKDTPEDGLQRLAASCLLKTLDRGAILFNAGERSEGLYLVLDGQIKLYARADNGQEKVIEVVEPGACIGESMVVGDVSHVIHARALCDARVLLVPRYELLLELRGNPGMAVRMMSDLSKRLNSLVKDIEAVTLHSGVERVIAYLLRQRVEGGDAAVHDLTVSLPASKGTIASLLSVTPEHFSRILHELQSRGLITVHRRQIHIPNVDRLACYA
jgi:CRP-like cAMP-binding protein